MKSSLDGMCDGLDRDGVALPVLERRGDEDLLSQAVYAGLPAPERQLLALAHSLVANANAAGHAELRGELRELDRALADSPSDQRAARSPPGVGCWTSMVRSPTTVEQPTTSRGDWPGLMPASNGWHAGNANGTKRCKVSSCAELGAPLSRMPSPCGP
jgi:hypothetical protein